MTQCEEILEYLRENGAITPVEAIQEFGCMRLAARIADLKDRGVKIRTTMAKGRNRKGQRVAYAKYILEDAKNEKEELNA